MIMLFLMFTFHTAINALLRPIVEPMKTLFQFSYRNRILSAGKLLIQIIQTLYRHPEHLFDSGTRLVMSILAKFIELDCLMRIAFEIK